MTILERETTPREIAIVKLAPDDWHMFKAFKILSLEQEAIAFEDQEKGLERYLAREDEEWKKMLGGKLLGKEGEAIYLFAQDGAILVGMLSVKIPKNDLESKNTAFIEHMYVEPDYRGKGIGRKLLLSIINELKEREGLERAWLSVISTQIPARKLYESAGFGAVKSYTVKRGQESFDEILMELELK